MFSTLTISTLGNLSLGAFYQYLAPKFLFLSKASLNKQLSAFVVSSFAQLFFQYKDKNTSEDPVFSDDFFDKIVRYTLPYILIGGSNCCINEVTTLKINIISTFLLGTAQLKVCQYSAAIVDELKDRKSFVFNGDDWDTHLGNIDNEPEKPKDLEAILNSDCPFHKGKKIKETHRLILIPKTLKGQSFNLFTLNEAIKNPKKGYKTKISAIIETLDKNNVSLEDIEQYIKPEHQAPYWILITKELVKCSGMNSLYRKPTPLEATTAILTQYVRLKKEICGRVNIGFFGRGAEYFTDCESDQLKSLSQKLQAEAEPAKQAKQTEIDQLTDELAILESRLERQTLRQAQGTESSLDSNTFWRSILYNESGHTETRSEEIQMEIMGMKRRIRLAEAERDQSYVIRVKVGAFSRRKIETNHMRYFSEGPKLFRDGLSVDVTIPTYLDYGPDTSLPYPIETRSW